MKTAINFFFGLLVVLESNHKILNGKIQFNGYFNCSLALLTSH
jgi:hypothetical protein